MSEDKNFFTDIRVLSSLLFICVAVIVGVRFLSFNEEKIVYFNGEINSETRDVSSLFTTRKISYLVGYYTLEDGGIKQFSMPKERTVIYYDLKEGEQCYAEYYEWIFGINKGEIKLHLHSPIQYLK